MTNAGEVKEMSDQFRKYRRKNIAEMLPWAPGMDMYGISVNDVDRQNGSPKEGDMIARNPQNHRDMWLVSKLYFETNFEPL